MPIENIMKIEVRDLNADGSVDKSEFMAALKAANFNKDESTYRITQEAYLAANKPYAGTLEKDYSNYL